MAKSNLRTLRCIKTYSIKVASQCAFAVPWHISSCDLGNPCQRDDDLYGPNYKGGLLMLWVVGHAPIWAWLTSGEDIPKSTRVPAEFAASTTMDSVTKLLLT